MTRTQQIIWAVVIVVILGLGYLWWASSQSSSQSASTTNSAGVTSTSTSSTNDQSGTGTGVSVSGSVSTGTGLPTSVTITFNGSSYSPANVTIAQGGTVTFTSTAGPMWVASDPHPVHNGYDGTTQQQHCAPSYTGPAPFDQCRASGSFSFTFNKVGTWGYHDHLNESAGGKITVVAQ